MSDTHTTVPLSKREPPRILVGMTVQSHRLTRSVRPSDSPLRSTPPSKRSWCGNFHTRCTTARSIRSPTGLRRTIHDAASTVFGDELPAWFTTSAQNGSAARVLIEASRGAQMLVLGTRGHGGFVGLMLGSVSSACATHAHCPVLIVRHEAEDAAAESRESLTEATDA